MLLSVTFEEILEFYKLSLVSIILVDFLEHPVKIKDKKSKYINLFFINSPFKKSPVKLGSKIF